jgi:hypothetical protein
LDRSSQEGKHKAALKLLMCFYPEAKTYGELLHLHSNKKVCLLFFHCSPFQIFTGLVVRSSQDRASIWDSLHQENQAPTTTSQSHHLVAALQRNLTFSNQLLWSMMFLVMMHLIPKPLSIEEAERERIARTHTLASSTQSVPRRRAVPDHRRRANMLIIGGRTESVAQAAVATPDPAAVTDTLTTEEGPTRIEIMTARTLAINQIPKSANESTNKIES